MRIRGDNAPHNAFTLEEQPKKPGYVLARFFEHVVPFEETIDGLTIRGYEYDEYHLELPNSADLYNDILERYDYYIAEAKKRDIEPIDELTQIRLAIAELAEAQTENNIAIQLAIAELAEAVLGGEG